MTRFGSKISIHHRSVQGGNPGTQIYLTKFFSTSHILGEVSNWQFASCKDAKMQMKNSHFEIEDKQIE